MTFFPSEVERLRLRPHECFEEITGIILNKWLSTLHPRPIPFAEGRAEQTQRVFAVFGHTIRFLTAVFLFLWERTGVRVGSKELHRRRNFAC
jgi:hypothetical protein